MKTLLLTSGGMDSWMIWRLLDQPQQIYLPLGHRYQAKERASLARLAVLYPAFRYREARILTLTPYEQPNGYIPLRNLLLASCAAIEVASAEQIVLGALSGEGSIDKSGTFLRELSRLLSYTLGRKVRVVAPYRHLTKTQLVFTYMERELKEDPDRGWQRGIIALRATVSCYHPVLKRCGRCQACFRRWVALTNNGISETYTTDPLERAGEFALNTSNLRQWFALWRQTDWRESWAIVQNNLDARAAIAQARRQEEDPPLA